MACSVLFLYTLSLFQVSVSSSQAAIPSPAANTELICHTKNAAECYPRIFQPSKEFQIVHEDQAIPAGLHIRLNLETGRKEAKINVPDTAPADVSHDLVLVDLPDEHKEALSSSSALDQTNPSKHQELLGKHIDVAEASVYATSVDFLLDSTDEKTLLDKLKILEDLSHSSHWGLTLAKNKDAMHNIVNIFNDKAGVMRLRCAAALLLSTTLQNNPPALKAALVHFPSANDRLPGLLNLVLPVLVEDESTLLLSRAISLLSAMSYDEITRCQFERSGGLTRMLRLFDAEKAGQDKRNGVRRKIANFFSDHFLQYSERTSQASDSEISELDGEDPWTILQKSNEDLCAVSENDLVQLEEAFLTALRALRGKEDIDESVQAKESIEQALANIQARRV